MNAMSPSPYRTISIVQRPFEGIEKFKRVITGSSVVIDGISHSRDAVFIEAGRWIADSAIKLSFAFDMESLKDALDTTGLNAEDLLLVISLRGVFLKENQTLRSEQLSQLAHYDGTLEFTINADDYPLITQDSYGGFQIVYSIVLGLELEHHPLRPSKIGTWLHQGAISIKPTRSNSQFRTESMSLEDKKEFRIPETAATYVAIHESIATAESLDSAATLYLDEDLYKHLNDQDASRTGQQFMMSIAIDFFMTLIAHAVQRLTRSGDAEGGEGAETVPPTSVLHNILEKVAKASGVATDFLISEVLVNPQVLRSYLEAYYEDLDGMLTMLKHERLE